MENLTPKDLAKQVARILNNFRDSKAKEFVSAVLRDHPTLQQRFMSEIVIRFIREVAKMDPNRFDLRNQKTKEICDILFGVLKAEYNDTGLPMI